MHYDQSEQSKSKQSKQKRKAKQSKGPTGVNNTRKRYTTRRGTRRTTGIIGSKKVEKIYT
jgi:hypothetical protein